MRPMPRYLGDCSTDEMTSPAKARKMFHISKKTISAQRRKIIQLQRENRRLKSRVMCLNSLLKFLKEKFLLTDSAEAVVTASVPSGSQEVIKRLLKGPSRQKYNPQIRTFALTLSFYSRKAYEYVREKFNNTLPHPDTISKWYRSVNGSPGFTEEALRPLKEKVELMTSKGYQMLCNLVMDEISIRRHVEWTGKKFTGYVDIGTNIDGDTLPEAKDALVFMLVAVNGHWKIPVGYFLIDGLSGQERANIIKNLLRFLHTSGVTVTSLTFDGAPANLNMAFSLGANFDDTSRLLTTFSHPVTDDVIFIFFDICHMIKLIRNCLGQYGILTDGQGNTINWKFFEKLVELQESEGLHAATKIRKRHIQWVNEKMKVKVACQTFSNSVSDALTYLEEDLKLDEFKGAKATAKFCKLINNMFDIFNSRTKFSKHPFKNAITAGKAEEIFNFLDYCKNYICSLKLNNMPVISSNRKTGFLGFLIGIESLNGFYKKYLICDTPLLKYILTYKFSQDHLEIFFSAIRNKCGSNNNPTARQFESIYKRLLIHTEIRSSKYANALPIDNTIMLYTTPSSVTKNTEGDDLQTTEEYLKITTALDDHDYVCSKAWNMTLYSSDIVAYISGFVVKCLHKCVTCNKCMELLEAVEPASFLQKRKTFGKMVNASAFVIKICKTGETYLKVYLSERSLSVIRENFINLLINHTIRNLPTLLFKTFDNHSIDDDPLNDHFLQLTKLILKHYFKVRLHHETTKINDSLDKRVRSVLTKTILFRHQ